MELRKRTLVLLKFLKLSSILTGFDNAKISRGLGKLHIGSAAFCSLHLHPNQFVNMEQANNPLHGVTLEQIVLQLVEKFGWEELGMKIRIDCFNNNPGLKSSLKFLRRTPWARAKVEDLYIKSIALKS